MKVKVALAREAHSAFSIEHVMLDDPRDDEVLVRIAGVGLCHTDLVARDQFIPVQLPAVLGHEGSGYVEKVGSAVKKVRPGDRVVLSFDSCGVCINCERHNPAYCNHFPTRNFAGYREDGSSPVHTTDGIVSANFFGQSSFASHALARERNVVKIDDPTLPLEILGPLGCGFQTGAGGVIRSMACPEGSSIAIFGAGPVGLAAVMGAVIRGCTPIIVVEPMAARRNLAIELGAHYALDPKDGDVNEKIRNIASNGLDFAFETSGKEQVVALALQTLASRGTLGLVGVPSRPDSTLAVNLASLITFGHRIQGIIEGDSDIDTFIPELLEHFKSGRFPINKLIRQYPLEKINDAIAEQASGICVKAVLIP